jgi:hypothetical protein
VILVLSDYISASVKINIRIYEEENQCKVSSEGNEEKKKRHGV